MEKGWENRIGEREITGEAVPKYWDVNCGK